MTNLDLEQKLHSNLRCVEVHTNKAARTSNTYEDSTAQKLHPHFREDKCLTSSNHGVYGAGSNETRDVSNYKERTAPQWRDSQFAVKVSHPGTSRVDG